MEKTRSSPLSYVFPWLSPLLIRFEIVNNGIEVQLYRNNRSLKNWQPSQLDRVIPEPLLKWIEENHIHEGSHPYPPIKQFWQSLLPLASKKLLIDDSALTALEEISQPADFALLWSINHTSMCFEGRFERADQYLGMGWFKRGTNIYQLNKPIPTTIDSQLKTLTMPLQYTDFLLDSIIPYLQQFFPTRADFRLFKDFTAQVNVSAVKNREIALELNSNYPQLLFTIQIPQSEVNLLLAHQAVIHYPRQNMTPLLTQLLQKRGGTTEIRGADIPVFIREQLPALQKSSLITAEQANKITQANPIVSIADLKPNFILTNSQNNGIGRYDISATYHYQKHTLDMNALLAGHQSHQRFVQQHAVWFEWPADSSALADTIQHSLVKQTLQPEEVMGFNSQRLKLIPTQPPAHILKPAGTTLAERAQSIFEQLRYHGIPGGILGEPKGLAGMFVNACEITLRANQLARILWLVPSNKKGSATRAIQGSFASSYVTVASPVTLRDEPALTSRTWTLVIFQELDTLLSNGGNYFSILPRLEWSWSLFSVTSKQTLNPFLMQILHLSEHHYYQFGARYLFDLEKSVTGTITNQDISDLKTIPRTPAFQPKKETTPPAASFLPSTPVRPASTPIADSSKSPLPSGSSLPPTPSQARPPVEARKQKSINLNQQKIARLQAESEQLWSRLSMEEEPQILSESNPAVPVKQQPVTNQLFAEKEKGEGEKRSYNTATSSVGVPTPSVIGTRYVLEEIKQISGNIAPVEERLAVMSEYWRYFEDIHAKQQTGMKPLWGLVDDFRSFDFEQRFVSNEPYQLQLYNQLLPTSLIMKIDQLWGSIMLPRWPEHIISEPFPHKLFAETFGQALKFWHGCALTVWFFCEGPYSRTSVAELADYYFKEVKALKEMGTPINEHLFSDLANAEKQLGRPKAYSRQIVTGQGSISPATIRTSYGTSRKGFEILRDIVSSYRRKWAENYLDMYLQKRWESEVNEAAQTYRIVFNTYGSSPPIRRLAKGVNDITNHWFGGNISELCQVIQSSSIQPPSSIQTLRITILPADRVAFAFAVFKQLRLRVKDPNKQKSSQNSQADPQIEKLANSPYYQLNKLAAYSFWHVQLEEALGHAPSLQEFGTSKFTQPSAALSADIQQAWKIFSSAISAAKQEMSVPAPSIDREQRNSPTTSVKPKAAREHIKAESNQTKGSPASTIRPVIQLNKEMLSKLHEESDQLQKRLIVEGGEEQEQPVITPAPDPVPTAPVITSTAGAIPVMDEDWQIILQHWQPEHWEVIQLLHQGQAAQLMAVGRKVNRPISKLIDEINDPVDEQLGDLFIDPDSQTISLHLQPIADSLILWYLSSNSKEALL